MYRSEKYASTNDDGGELENHQGWEDTETANYENTLLALCLTRIFVILLMANTKSLSQIQLGLPDSEAKCAES